MKRKRGERLEKGRVKLIIVNLLHGVEKSMKDIRNELAKEQKIGDYKTIYRHLKELKKREVINCKKENGANLWFLTDNTEARNKLFGESINPVIKNVGKEFEKRLPSEETLFMVYQQGKLTVITTPKKKPSKEVEGIFKELEPDLKKVFGRLKGKKRKIIEEYFKDAFGESFISSTQPSKR